MVMAFAEPIKVTPPQGFIPQPFSLVERSVGEIFREVVARYPHQVAVVDPDRTITYLALNQQANRLAHAVRGMDAGGQAPIPFLLGRDGSAIAAVLGILKAGRIYLALDTANPLEYLKTILRDARPRLLITDTKHLSLAQQLAGDSLRILNMDELGIDLPDGDPDEDPKPTTLAAVFYTSGTTGVPKGVILDQRALLHRAWVHIHLHYLAPEDRSPLPFPFSFAWSITPIFTSLLSGGMLFPVNYADLQPERLADWLKENRISILHISPVHLRQLFAVLPEDSRHFQHIRLVNAGGAELFPQDVESWKKHFRADSILAYGLASTETGTVARKFFNTGYETAGNKLPVGYTVPTVTCKLLNEEGEEVVPGEIGEVAVQSLSMVRGYWGGTGLDQAAFHQDENSPAGQLYRTGDLGRLLTDGALELHGRRDAMVKVRGYRVNTEEITSALAGHAGIQENHIAVKANPANKEDRLVAYIVPKKDHACPEKDVRIFLAKRLPHYMMPARFVFLEALPLNTHGKVDASALPEPADRAQGSFTAPRNREEQTIAQIWCDLLGLESIGVEDNFFDWGGDSLSALTMALEVERQLGQAVPQTFFQKATIANLVDLLGQKEQGGAPAPEASAAAPSMGPVKKASKKKYRPGVARLGSKDFWLNRVIAATPMIYRRSVLGRSYLEGFAWLQDWCRRPLVAHGIYQAKFELFSRMIASLEGCAVDAEAAFPSNLMGNILQGINRDFLEDSPLTLVDKLKNSRLPFWKSLLAFIKEAPLSVVNEHYSVSGLNYLEHAQQAGRGVIILTYHSTINNLAMSALSRQVDCGAIHTVSRKVAALKDTSWQHTRSANIPLPLRSAMNASEALQGQNLLAQGRIVQVVGDGDTGMSLGFRPMQVAGRPYFLSSGFAELALNTGAVIVPQFTTLLRDGRIHTTFLSPLVPPSGGREAQVADLLEQYARFMFNSWKAAPESLRWKKMQRHFQKPRNRMMGRTA